MPKYIIIVCLSPEERETFYNIHSNEIKLFASYLKKQSNQDFQISIIEFNPHKGFTSDQCIFMKTLMSNDIIYIFGHSGNTSDFITTYETRETIHYKKLAKMISFAVGEKSIESPINIHLIICDTARVGDNLEMGFAPKFHQELMRNGTFSKVSGFNQMVFIAHTGAIHTIKPEARKLAAFLGEKIAGITENIDWLRDIYKLLVIIQNHPDEMKQVEKNIEKINLRLQHKYEKKKNIEEEKFNANEKKEFFEEADSEGLGDKLQLLQLLKKAKEKLAWFEQKAKNSLKGRAITFEVHQELLSEQQRKRNLYTQKLFEISDHKNPGANLIYFFNSKELQEMKFSYVNKNVLVAAARYGCTAMVRSLLYTNKSEVNSNTSLTIFNSYCNAAIKLAIEHGHFTTTQAIVNASIPQQKIKITVNLNNLYKRLSSLSFFDLTWNPRNEMRLKDKLNTAQIKRRFRY